MAAYLQVTAACVVVKDESGAQHTFYTGAILPAGLNGDHVKMLLDDGMVSEVNTDEVVVEEDWRDGKVADILARVGEDKALAADVLAFEQAKGEDARTSLVTKLEKLSGS